MNTESVLTQKPLMPISTLKSTDFHALLEPMASKYMTHFLDDFYVHDLNSFENFQGKFLWMMRKTGSDILSFDPQIDTDYEEYKAAYTTANRFYDLDLANAIIKRNDHFFVPNKNMTGIEKLSKTKANEYVNEHMNYAAKFWL